METVTDTATHDVADMEQELAADPEYAAWVTEWQERAIAHLDARSMRRRSRSMRRRSRSMRRRSRRPAEGVESDGGRPARPYKRHQRRETDSAA